MLGCRPNGDRHTCGDPLETDMPEEFNWSISWYLLWHNVKVSEQACRFLMGLRSDMSVFDGSRIRHVGLRSGMKVSEQASRRSPLEHVGLQWVSDQGCWSPTCLRWVTQK